METRIVEYSCGNRKNYVVQRKTIFGNWVIMDCTKHNGFTSYDSTAYFDTLKEAQAFLNPPKTKMKVVG